MRRKLIAAALAVGSMLSLVVCGYDKEPEGILDSYVYNQVQINHEVKIPIEDIFMVNIGRYIAKVNIGTKNGITPAYDMEILTNEKSSADGTVGYVVGEPAINYVDGDESYIIVTDSGKRMSGYGIDNVHEMNVKIYISHGSLNSMPNNKGKAGTDPNVKVN